MPNVPPPSAAAQVRNESNPLRDLRVLVVDDSEFSREVASTLLEDAGARVACADDGFAALHELAAMPGRFDLVLMDLQMPGIDGCETTRRLRNLPACGALRVIGLSATSAESERDGALAAGMAACLAKPFDPDELCAVLQRADPVPARATGQAALPLVDFEAARRQWPDPDRHRKSLDQFVSLHGDDARRLANAGEARGIAHRLAGAAAAVALPRVAALARELERRLLAGEPIADSLPVLETALAQTVAAINDCRGGRAAATAPARPAAAAQDELFARLRCALDGDDPDLVEPLLPALATLLPAATAQSFCTCIENFDFRGAEQLLAAVATGGCQATPE